MPLIDAILQRPVIIALAIIGASIATLGSYHKARHGDTTRSQRLIVVGYAVTALSVVVFIVAGFRSAWL